MRIVENLAHGTIEDEDMSTEITATREQWQREEIV
jgi:hypothetical protein